MNAVNVEYQDLLEEVVCNNCGADDFNVVYCASYDQAKPEEIKEAFRSSGDEILVDQMVQCKKCQLQYLNPRLNQNVILEGYSAGSDEQFVSQAAGREKTFAKCLDKIEQLQPQRGKILDVGTAGGSFLSVAKKRGWDVFGCEPNVWLTQWCKKKYDIDVAPGTIFDMNLKDNSFDVVTLWDVLEHVPDPQKVLAECNRVLKPDGLLIVNYPDIGSFVAKTMARKWVFLLSVHLYYFDKISINTALEKSGFKLERIQKHWQSLELDYILFRMKPYVGVLADWGRNIVKVIGLKNAIIPYWMGQSLAMARKQ